MKVWTREESKERFPKAMSPLGWSLLQVPMQATLTQMSKTLGTREYQASELMLCHDFYVYTRKNFFKDLRNVKLKPGRLLFLLAQGLGSLTKTTLTSFSRRGPWLSRLSQDLFLRLFAKQIQELLQSWQEQKTVFTAKMGRDYQLEGRTEISYEEFRRIRQQMQADSIEFFAEDFNVYFLKHLLAGLLKSQLLRQGVAEEEALRILNALSNGLDGNFSVRMIEDFSSQEWTPQQLQKKYGHLTDNWDIFSPVFAEQESFWEKREIPRFGADLRLARENALSEIRRILSWNSQLVTLLAWYQQLILVDEDLRAYSSLQYPQARRLMALVQGTAFWPQELTKDAIYFLSLEEIEKGLRDRSFADVVSTMRARALAYLEASQQPPPFELIEGATDSALRAVPPPQSGVEVSSLAGICVSNGRTRGRVAVIRDPKDLHKITRNSVIVIETATPVFSPFYASCGGIIAEVGGQLSHGAIVARECGIPMLTGVENACLLLTEGQEVLLDADNGVIEVLEYELR